MNTIARVTVRGATLAAAKSAAQEARDHHAANGQHVVRATHEPDGHVAITLWMETDPCPEMP